jgi:hypothetical protein
MIQFFHLLFRLSVQAGIVCKSIRMPDLSKITMCLLDLLRSGIRGQAKNREGSRDGLTTRHGLHSSDIYKECGRRVGS